MKTEHKSIRILLADDHAAFREGVRGVLKSHPELDVVAEAQSGADAVRLAAECHPDVALLDVRMEPVTGIQAIPRILRDSPATAILMVSMHADRRYVTLSIAAGARGYLLKDSLEETLLPAILAVYRGGIFFSPEVEGYAAAGA